MDHRCFVLVACAVAALAGAVPARAQSIGYAALQFPLATLMPEPCAIGMPVFGRVYVAGATDANSAPAGGMVAQLGVFPDGTSDPAMLPASAWTDAIPNPGWDFGNNDDEYEALLAPHASGVFDYAYRFSYANGPFVYADSGMGFADGYSAADAGQLVVDGDVLFCDRFDVLVP